LLVRKCMSMRRSNPKLSELENRLAHHKSQSAIPEEIAKKLGVKFTTNQNSLWFRGASSLDREGGTGLALFGEGLYLTKSPYFAWEYSKKHKDGKVYLFKVHLNINVVETTSLDFIQAFETALVLANPLIDIGYYAYIDRRKRVKGSFEDLLRLAYQSQNKEMYVHYLSLLEDEMEKVVSFELEPDQQDYFYQILRKELESKGYRGILAYTLRKGLLLFYPEEDAKYLNSVRSSYLKEFYN